MPLNLTPDPTRSCFAIITRVARIGSGLKFGQVEVSQSDPNSVRTFKDIQGLNCYDRAL